MKTLSKVGLIILCLLFGLGITLQAKAETRTLTISPVLMEEVIDPGQSVESVMKVRNDGTTKQIVNITVQNFLPKGETGEQVFIAPEEGDTSWSLAKWIKLNETAFELEPQATKEVKVTISVPKEAEAGSHYAVVFAEIATPKVEGETVVSVKAKVGCLVLMTVSGESVAKGEIKGFKTDKNVYFSPLVKFTTRFENTGNVHVKPTGSIKITTRGKQVTEIPVNEKLGNALPKSIRAFENTWESIFAFGRYKAEATLTYGDKEEIKADSTFWMIPWSVLAIIGLIIIALIVIGKTIDIVPQGARHELFRLKKKVTELETEKKIKEEEKK